MVTFQGGGKDNSVKKKKKTDKQTKREQNEIETNK